MNTDEWIRRQYPTPEEIRDAANEIADEVRAIEGLHGMRRALVRDLRRHAKTMRRVADELDKQLKVSSES